MRPDIQQMRLALQTQGGYAQAARFLRDQGFETSRDSIRRNLEKLNPVEDFQVDLPDGWDKTFDVDSLITRRAKEFERRHTVHQQKRAIPIAVKTDGPIGLGLMGDPHVDDDGCDISTLFRHVDLFDGRHPGLFAAGLGDQSNNWCGGLARLWAEQSTSAAEARALVQELLDRVRWMFVILGNHDVWNNGQDLLTHMLARNTAVNQYNRTRLGLKLPNGRVVKIYAAHGFPGKSMWSEVFAAAKKAQLDGHHHIYCAGHIHTSGYSHGIHPGSQEMWHAVQVASYKKIDKYAEQLILEDKALYSCPVALIDPSATNEMNFIRFEFDPEEGAERLAWMRKRWAESKSAS